MADTPTLADARDLNRWIRRRATKENIVNFLKTAVWVVPLTILIWVYADQEQATTESNVPILISISSADPNRLVTLLRPGEDIPTADLRGSRSSLDRVKQQLAKAGDNRLVRVTVPNTMQPGPPRELPIALAVQNAPIFTENRITVTNVRPQTVQIAIDTIRDEEIEVKAPPGADNLVGPPVFEPRTVRIRAPSQVLEEARLNGRLVAYADFSANPDLAKPGNHEPTLVPISTPIRADHVDLSVHNVMATVNVKQRGENYEIPSMPVRIAPFLTNQDVTVQSDQTNVTNVNVYGPPEQLQFLRDKKVVPFAILYINREDVGKGNLQRTLEYTGLPDGVSVVEADKRKPFTFSVTQKAQ